MTALSAGFCNFVYRCELKTSAADRAKLSDALKAPPVYVIKIFSDLAKLRLDKERLGVVDFVASELAVAPRVVLATNNLIVHDWVYGRILTEDDLAGAPPLPAPAEPLLAPVFEFTEKLSSIIEESPIWDRVEEYTGKLSERSDVQRAKALLLGQMNKAMLLQLLGQREGFEWENGQALPRRVGRGPATSRGKNDNVEVAPKGRAAPPADVDARALGASIAQKLADLHMASMPTVLRKDTTPILLSSMDKMVKHIAKRPDLLPPQFSVDMLMSEVDAARVALEALPLPVVMGHGDFKPSNVMLRESSEKMSGEYESPKFQRSLAERLESGDLMVTFIDFELGGPNYRGFDIFKLFRRGQVEGNGEGAELIAHQNLRAFVAAYLEAIERNHKEELARMDRGGTGAHEKEANRQGATCGGGIRKCDLEASNLTYEQETALGALAAARSSIGGNSAPSKELGQSTQNEALEALLAEVYLFEPLTWLEAAAFFLFAIQDEQGNTDVSKLAVHLWENYERSKGGIQKNAEALLAATGGWQRTDECRSFRNR